MAELTGFSQQSGAVMVFWRSAWAVGWKSAVFLLLSALMLGPWVGLFELLLRSRAPDHPQAMQLYFDASSAIAVLVASGLMLRLVDRRPFATLGLAPSQAPLPLVIGLLAGLGWLGLTLAVLGVLGCLSWVGPAAWPSSLGMAAAAVFCNTITQEALFRGYLFQTIRSYAGATGAVLGTSLIFAAVHVPASRESLLAAVNVFGAGVLFALAYYRSGSLWLPVGMHFAWNFALNGLLGLTVSGQHGWAGGTPWFLVHGASVVTGGAFGVEGSIITSLTTACLIAVLCGMRYRSRRSVAPTTGTESIALNTWTPGSQRFSSPATGEGSRARG